MKTLKYLAILPLMAAASQAITLDVGVGYATPKPYDGGTVVGFGIGTQLNREFHLGLNYAQKNIVSTANLVDAKARAVTLDLTYELNSSPYAAIRPFVGVGVGVVRFSGASIATGSTSATKLFAGIAFKLSNTVDVILTEQNVKFYNVQELAGGPKIGVTSWESVAALRFKF